MIRAWFCWILFRWHTEAANDWTASAAYFRAEGRFPEAMRSLHKAGEHIAASDRWLDRYDRLTGSEPHGR